PHISSDTINVKERGTKLNQIPETKSTGSTASLWRNPINLPRILPAKHRFRSSRPLRLASRRAPQRRR
ncbi:MULTISPECIES: hypothetical protein, partial [unclassified Aliiroseovarius]|uniref:hypothetical protein n=1 Tax=unclassified Aliiroseovarius TaxID=2623558 RepID=UPI001C2C1BC9